MKKILFLLLVLPGFSLLHSQLAPQFDGKAHAEIFTDFHTNIRDTTTGFGLNRALIGYSFIPVNNFTATVVVNIGSPEDLAPGSESRRYAFFREAFITYFKNKLSLNMGIVKTHLSDYQGRFIGKRYVANTLQSTNDYGYLADLGIGIDYRFSEVVEANIGIMNGEGYCNIQMDNNLKVSGGLCVRPSGSIMLRIFGDVIRREGYWQSTVLCFAGIKNDRITLGGDIIYKSKPDLIDFQNAWGVSGTGALRLTEKTEIFGRYDHSSTINNSGDEMPPWIYLHDYNFLVAGFQYTFSPNVRMAIDYQGTYAREPGSPVIEALYLNAHFKF